MILRNTILLPFLLLLFNLPANAQLTADTDLNEDTVWGISDSPVTVSEIITVMDGATLTIEPGVTVLMSGGTSLLIEGSLVADGSESARILFTSSAETAGAWGSVEFRNNSNVGSVFNHITVEYGAGTNRSGMVFYTTGSFPVAVSNSIFRNSAEHGINLRASSVPISESEFYDNAGYGIFADLSLNFSVTESNIYQNTQGGIRVPLNSQAVITESVIENNGIGILIENNGRPQITNSQIRENNTGIRIQEVGSSQPLIRENNISGNSVWGIQSLGGNVLDARFNFWGSPQGPTVNTNPTGNGDAITTNIDYTPWRDGTGMDLPVITVDSNISDDTTWESGNVYLVTVNLTVGANTVLTIEPGTIVKFESGRTMTVNGSLLANGTESNMIVITSDRDDSAGGDSNEDGDATTPGPGNWGKIVINSPGSEISNAIIRYGSAGSGASGVLDLNALISLNSIFVINNSGTGIYSEAPQSEWTNVNTISNSSRGIYMREVALQMSGGVSSLNGGDGIYFLSSTSGVHASILDGIEVADNGGHGIHINGSSTRNGNRIAELTNSVIRGNSAGLLLEYSDSGPQLFQNNTIENNSSHGITLHHGLTTEDVVFEGNTLSNNGQTGIRANRARFINNEFTGNRFGIGTWYNLDLSYTDDADVDSNTFSGNTYGGIALYSTGLNGTLSATVPQSFEHPAYVVASVGLAVSSPDTFIIEPGVTIKAGPGLVNSNTSFRITGTLIAEGTDENPVVFTSLYDHEYGGNIAPEGSTSEASPGDWGGIHLSGNGTLNSVLEHMNIRYGRINLEMGTQFGTQVEYVNEFNNLWIDNASLHGIFIEESSVRFLNIVVTNNRRHGIWLRDRSNNGFVSKVEINFSEIRGNGGTNSSYAGLYAQSLAEGSTFDIVEGNLIEENANGIVIEDAALTTSIASNTIRNNVHHGVTLVSNRERKDIIFFGNTISGNGKSGILSSKAVFISNKFYYNQYGVGAWNRLGHVFVDENSVDENEFIGNDFNNSIALYATNLRDTLSATVPEAFEYPTYLLVTSGSANNSSHTLLIEPGVTVKTGTSLVNNNTQLRFNGTLIAEGTVEAPIVFTSLNDHEYGGNIALVEDTKEAAPDDWGGVHLASSGTADSRLNHVFIRYGRTNLEMGTTFSNPVEYSNPFKNLWIDSAARHGIFIEESSVEFDSLRVTNSGRHGVWIRDRISNGFLTRAIVRNSEISNNGGTNSLYAGLYAQSLADNSSFSEITNTVIKNNSNGVIIESSPLPSSFQFNQIADNVHNGVYAQMVSVTSDTALAVSGNTFSGHQNGTGIISTRAIIEDNSFENNEFPIAVMGELSRDETANANGNFYDGNTFANNTYRDAIGIYSTTSISLDGNLGYSWPDEFTNPVYVPIAGTTYINSGSSVNVAPGTVFKLGRTGSNDSFRIRGTLKAEGEADKKIVFTSLIDDTYGGDTNRDSTDTAPSRANWGKLLVDGSSSSQTRFKHVIARYGSNNFEFTNNTEAIIDSSFSSNATYGIYSLSGAKPTVRNSDIHTNRYGIRVQSNSDDPNIHVNNFYNNDDAALYVFRDVTATNNFWGHSSGPFVDQGSNTDPNLDGQGDRILISGSNRVEYDPWRVSRSGILLGDVSESGSVSAFDASLILQYSVGDIVLSTSQLAAADVSGDGTVSAFDASQILQFVVGIISGFDGAGKIPSFVPEDIFTLYTRVTDSYFDVVIESQGTIPLLAGEIALDYDEVRFSSVELLSTGETANWSSRVRAENGVAKAALAGVEAAASAGDVIHLRFHFEDEFAGAPGEFEITNLVLNEIDFTESANTVLTSSVDEHQLPQKFALEQNFPNPFNPTTNIRYQLPESGEVTVSVFNAIGQQVAVLANREQQTAGVYTLNWDAGSSASGVYFYRIEVAGTSGSNFMDVRKMTLIK